MRIGVLGGTFNPPHLGHLICVQEAYLQLELDVVTLIPAREPPHKPVDDEPGIQHRLELCRLAARGDERLRVSDLEARRTGPSYTVDTLQELDSHDPDSELFLIVGGDIAAGLPEWHRPKRVLELARLAVAQRRGTSIASIQLALDELGGRERTDYFHMPTIGISSTLVRARVRAGKPIRYLVPDSVAGYIEREGLYVAD